MRLLTRYTLREVAIPSALALVVVGFIGVAAELREQLRGMSLTFFELMDFYRLAVWFFPTLLPYVVPVMYLLGTMMAFGGLAQNNEIVAMKAAGIPLKRIVAPVLALGVLLSAGAFVVQDRVQPEALKRISLLIYRELPQRATLDVLTPGVMHELDKWRVYIGGRDRATGTLRDVDILETQDSGEVWLYHAAEARFTHEDGRPELRIPDGYLIMPEEGGRANITRIRGFRLRAPAPEVRDIPTLKRMLTTRELLALDEELSETVRRSGGLTDLSALYAIRDLARHPERLPQGVSIDTVADLYEVRSELRERVTMPLACIALCLVAAPLAVRGGRGGRSWGFAIGFAVCLAYYVMWVAAIPRGLCSLAESLARGAAPSVALACVGAVLIWRVDRV